MTSTGFAQFYFDESVVSVGATFQDGGTGIQFISDTSFNDYVSVGGSVGYVFSVDQAQVKEVDPYDGTVTYYDVADSETFLERMDFNLRLNVHFNEIAKLPENLDVYAGGNFGRNIGSQVGVRYAFADWFGVYGEAVIPIVKNIFKLTEGANYYKLYEQPVIGIGVFFSN